MVSLLTRGASGYSHSILVIGNQLRPLAAPVLASKSRNIPVPSTSENVSMSPLITGRLKASTSFTGLSSVRASHSDITVPDYSSYRLPSTHHIKNFRDGEYKRKENRKAFTYAVTAGVYMGGAVALRAVLTVAYKNWNPTDDVLALASVEVPVTEVPEGKSVTFKWRGKPLFIRHRTAEEIEREGSVNLAELRDPQHDSDRVTNPKFLIVVGICTHLGCVPIPDAGDFGGYYCPCHGSHYDASGRIRKGPAPENLEVPEHTYLTDEVVKIG